MDHVLAFETAKERVKKSVTHSMAKDVETGDQITKKVALVI